MIKTIQHILIKSGFLPTDKLQKALAAFIKIQMKKAFEAGYNKGYSDASQLDFERCGPEPAEPDFKEWFKLKFKK